MLYFYIMPKSELKTYLVTPSFLENGIVMYGASTVKRYLREHRCKFDNAVLYQVKGDTAIIIHSKDRETCFTIEELAK